MSISEIKKTLTAIHQGRLVEIRALGVPSKYKRQTLVGYFTDYDRAAAAAHECDEAGATAVYMTLNDIHHGCLARAANRMVQGEISTSDNDIVKRRYILIDIDAIRPPGISSSDEELQAAFDLRLYASRIICDAINPGIVIWACSGNGYHIIIDSASCEWDPKLEESVQVRAFLESLNNTVAADSGCVIDTSVFNLARITKLYGTMARKGDSINGRPHRRSFIEGVWTRMGFDADAYRSGDGKGDWVRTLGQGSGLLGAPHPDISVPLRR